MLFKQVIFAASASAAVLTPSHGAVTRSAKPGVVYNTLNLDDFDPAMNNGALDKRVDWKWCAQSGQNIGELQSKLKSSSAFNLMHSRMLITYNQPPASTPELP